MAILIGFPNGRLLRKNWSKTSVLIVEAVCCTTISKSVTESEVTVMMLLAIVPISALVAFGVLKIVFFKNPSRNSVRQIFRDL